MLTYEYSPNTTKKTLLENDSYSENTRVNIAKNLFWYKKEQLQFLRFYNLWVFWRKDPGKYLQLFPLNTALLRFSGYFLQLSNFS